MFYRLIITAEVTSGRDGTKGKQVIRLFDTSVYGITLHRVH